MAPITYLAISMHSTQSPGQAPVVTGDIMTNVPVSDIAMLTQESLIPQFLIPDLDRLLNGGPGPLVQFVQDETEEEEAEEDDGTPATHPCGREIAACQEIGSTDHNSIEVRRP